MDTGNSPRFVSVAVVATVATTAAVAVAATAVAVATGAFFRLALDFFPMMRTINNNVGYLPVQLLCYGRIGMPLYV